jgi:hypothetical protein
VKRLLGILMLFVGCGADRMRPVDEVLQVSRALNDFAPEVGKNVRFLSLATIPDEEKPIAAAVASFALNSLGDAGYIKRPEWVPGTNLVAFNLRDYANSEATYKVAWETWERMAGAEPYFHVQQQVAEEVESKDAKGKAVVSTEVKTVTIDAPWIDADLTKHVRETSASIGPVMRLEYWLSQVMQPPHYYTLAGVPQTEEEFLKLLGIDAAEVRSLGRDKGANVVSKVAFGRSRRVSSYVGPYGALWVTKDVFATREKRDAIRQPLNTSRNPTTGELVKLFEYDAGEFIASKANGLHLFALYDAQHQRQDAVPLGGPGKSIARDTSEDHPGFDGVVVPGLSCIRCHTESGLRPIDDVQSTLPGIAALPDAQAILSFYNPPQLQLRLKQARENYALAVSEACDLSSEQVAAGLGSLVRTQLYELVTDERAAQECGCDLGVFIRAAELTSDPYAQLLAQGKAVHREAWEATFPLVMQEVMRPAEEPAPEVEHATDQP